MGDRGHSRALFGRPAALALVAVGVSAILAGCSSNNQTSSSHPATTTASQASAASSVAPSHPRDLVFFTSKAGSSSTASVSFHVYDASLKQPIGSACVGVPDVGDLAVPSDIRAKTPVIYVGVTENSVVCNDPSIAKNEAAGTPAADQHFVAACRSLSWDGTDIYRYPAEFTMTTPPSCTSQGYSTTTTAPSH